MEYDFEPLPPFPGGEQPQGNCFLPEDFSNILNIITAFPERTYLLNSWFKINYIDKGLRVPTLEEFTVQHP